MQNLIKYQLLKGKIVLCKTQLCIFQTDYAFMRGKRLAPWLQDWIFSNMLFEQSGLVQKDFQLQKFAQLRDFLFDKNEAIGKEPDPFTLEQIGVSFAFLLSGIVIGIFSFLIEVNALVEGPVLAGRGLAKGWGRVGDMMKSRVQAFQGA